MPSTVLDKYNREESIPVYWWFDQKKATALEKAMTSKTALEKSNYDVIYK